MPFGCNLLRLNLAGASAAAQRGAHIRAHAKRKVCECELVLKRIGFFSTHLRLRCPRQTCFEDGARSLALFNGSIALQKNKKKNKKKKVDGGSSGSDSNDARPAPRIDLSSPLSLKQQLHYTRVRFKSGSSSTQNA